MLGGGFSSSPDPRYKFLRSLGTGSYGAVAAFHDHESGKDVAMKRIAQALDDFLVCRRTLREVKLMRHFHHPNLLHLVDVLPVQVAASQVFVVTPLMDWDLDHMLRKKGVRLSGTEVCNFLVQMLLGLLHLHSGHVIHRDLKPANIFVRKDGLVKIGDLGLSRGIDLEDGSSEPIRPADEALTEYVVTRWYRAPEVILIPAEYGPPVDVWSVGCILYEMVTGKVLFQGRSSFDQLRRIVAILGRPKGRAADWLQQASSAKRMLHQLPDSPPQLQKLRQDWHVKSGGNELKSLLEDMLAFDPDARPSLENALELPCFADALSGHEIAEAKMIHVFQQEYDKEFDALDRSGERRMLPRVVKLLHEEVSDFRNESGQSSQVEMSTRQRTSTPPRISAKSTASASSRRTPPRTAAGDSKKDTRDHSGPRSSMVEGQKREPRDAPGPRASVAEGPRASLAEARKDQPRDASGPRVSMAEARKEQSRDASGPRSSVVEAQRREQPRDASGPRSSIAEAQRQEPRDASGPRSVATDGQRKEGRASSNPRLSVADARRETRDASSQRLSIPEAKQRPSSARSSASGSTNRGQQPSDHAPHSAAQRLSVDMAALQHGGPDALSSANRLSSANPMSARSFQGIYGWAAEDDDESADAPVLRGSSAADISGPPWGPPALSSRPSSAPRTSRRASAAAQKPLASNGAFSAAARGDQEALAGLVDDLETRPRNRSVPAGNARNSENPQPAGGFRGVEAWAAVPTESKRDELLAARAEAARRERERAEARKQAEETRVQEPERFLAQVGLELQQRQKRRASEVGTSSTKDDLRAARDEAVRREQSRNSIAVPGHARRRGHDVQEPDEVVSNFLRGLR